MHDGLVEIIDETYTTARGRSMFRDVEHGEWSSVVKTVLDGRGHPQRGRIKAGERISARSSESNEKRRRTTFDKYGVENISMLSSVKDKARQTTLDRHGFENVFQNPEVQDRIRSARASKCGVEYPLQSAEIRERMRLTMMDRYGVEYATQSPHILEIIRKTSMERYGCDNPSQSCVVKSKRSQTNLELYGVENPAQNPEIHRRMTESRRINGTLYVSHKEADLTHEIKMLCPSATSTSLRYDGTQKVYNIDILIPEKHVAIEFNGMYWHSEANKRIHRRYHLEKTLAAEHHGLRLIHIWEYEWDKRREQVLSYLRSVLGTNEQRVMARKCRIIAIDRKTGEEFMKRSHLLGMAPPGHEYISLMSDGQIVSVASFGPHHRGSPSVVMSRFASLPGLTVSGALGRLSMEGARRHGRIITWCERRLGSTQAYEAAGWRIETVLSPDYFYWDGRRDCVVSKQSRRKSAVNTPDGVTEYEHSVQDGLLRIWDCGKVRLVFGQDGHKIAL